MPVFGFWFIFLLNILYRIVSYCTVFPVFCYGLVGSHVLENIDVLL